MKDIVAQTVRIVARYVAGYLAASAMFQGVEQAVLETAVSGVLIAVSEAWWLISQSKKTPAKEQQ
jgi:hypothetical protein